MPYKLGETLDALGFVAFLRSVLMGRDDEFILGGKVAAGEVSDAVERIVVEWKIRHADAQERLGGPLVDILPAGP